jgi:hypothetical protein
MNAFIRNIILFVSIFVSYAGVNYVINKTIINRSPAMLSGYSVVLGDSHTMTAINPQYFPKTQNIAQTAEPYIVSYLKLKELLRHNRIDTVMLGFSFQNISSFNDKKLSDPIWSNEMFKRIYGIVSLDELMKFQRVDIDYMNYLRAYINNMLIFPKRNHLTYIGKFSKRRGTLDTVKQHPETAIRRHFFEKEENIGISAQSIAYLDSIITLLNKKDIKLILVSTPIHKSYRKLIPNNFTLSFKSLSEQLIKRDIQVLDYSSYYMPDSCFFDYDHLNILGANEFSKVVSSQLNKHIKKN